MPGTVVVEAGLRVELAAREAVILQDGGDRLLPLSKRVVDIARNDRVGGLLRDRDDGALTVRMQRVGRARTGGGVGGVALIAHRLVNLLAVRKR